LSNHQWGCGAAAQVFKVKPPPSGGTKSLIVLDRSKMTAEQMATAHDDMETFSRTTPEGVRLSFSLRSGAGARAGAGDGAGAGAGAGAGGRRTVTVVCRDASRARAVQDFIIDLERVTVEVAVDDARHVLLLQRPDALSQVERISGGASVVLTRTTTGAAAVSITGNRTTVEAYVLRCVCRLLHLHDLCVETRSPSTRAT
jgi:hypothetical protein